LKYKGFVAKPFIRVDVDGSDLGFNFVEMLRILMLILITASAAMAQQAEVVKFDKVEEVITSKSDKIQVINFWATWCAPCVKELPYFQSLEASQDPDVAITLVNLDYADRIRKVNAFISKKKMTSRVLLLDDIDYNSWIDKVDPSWGGAIPATLFINTSTGQRRFVEGELTESELASYLKEVKSSN
jgi:thiol-disulfide isomerase/thioredoxin